MESRTCTKCGEEKLFSEFPKDRAKKQGISPRCKACNAVYSSEYYAANKEKIATYQRNWREANKDFTSAYHQRKYKAFLEEDARLQAEIEERQHREAEAAKARVNISRMIAERDAADLELRWEALKVLKTGDRKRYKELERERKDLIRAMNKQLKNILE